MLLNEFSRDTKLGIKTSKAAVEVFKKIPGIAGCVGELEKVDDSDAEIGRGNRKMKKQMVNLSRSLHESKTNTYSRKGYVWRDWQFMTILVDGSTHINCSMLSA